MAADPNAVFVNMTITFRTLDDDKDRDTRLEVWINKPGPVSVAYRDIRGVEFPNDKDNVFDVPPDPAPTAGKLTLGEVPGSNVQLKIHPVGHDTWKFRFDATLRFVSETTGIFEINRKFGKTALDQDVTYGVYPL